jgi:L-ascorbate metabolism protein UlaG (beta-lactamase superfamily)
VVLLSHDHHGDNLDTTGRALLPSAGAVLTTTPGARRLGGNARGLQPWGDHPAGGPGTPDDPGHRHPLPPRPPHSRPIAGDVIGFALGWEGQEHEVLWITGDTVLYDGVRQVADRLQVGTALLHLGCVRFPVTGPVRYSMTAREAIQLCRLVRPRTAIPVHYKGWTHFRPKPDRDRTRPRRRPRRHPPQHALAAHRGGDYRRHVTTNRRESSLLCHRTQDRKVGARPAVLPWPGWSFPWSFPLP